MRLLLLLPLVLFSSRLSLVWSSYLHAPRIHFNGYYRADVNSQNNCPCNFDVNLEVDSSTIWNYRGTNEWELVDTYITGVTDENGQMDKNSSFLGAQVFSSSSAGGPHAKVIALDVNAEISSLFGAILRIQVGGEDVISGKWSRSVVSHDMWQNIRCGSMGADDANFTSSSTSIVTDLHCPTTSESLNLCRLWNTTKLSVSMTMGYFTTKDFLIGKVLGTIGISRDGEPLNIGGERKMQSTNQPITVCPNSKPVTDTIYVVPFLYDTNRDKLVLDISNTFPVNDTLQQIDLGCLWLGVQSEGRVTIFGESLPYLDSNVMWNYGGIVEYSVPSELQSIVQTSPIVIVVEEGADQSGEHLYQHKSSLPSQCSLESGLMVLLEESRYFIRATDYYHGRLEYGIKDHDTSQMTLLVTEFGRPSPQTLVRVDGIDAPPIGGVSALQEYQLTNAQGLVTYEFKVNKPIPFPRRYWKYPCSKYDCPGTTNPSINHIKARTNDSGYYELPVNGQIYHFCYFVVKNGEPIPSCVKLFNQIELSQVITFLAYSTFDYQPPYTWVDHVEPIFKQYYHLHYAMRAYFDMSSYDEVTQPNTLRLLKRSLGRDINHAGYMPVTRDLSHSTMNMLLEWLDNPCYSMQDCVSIDKCPFPSSGFRQMTEDKYERCGLTNVPTKAQPQAYFQEMFQDPEYATLSVRVKNPPRPLFGCGSEEEMAVAQALTGDIEFAPVCNEENLKKQLQLAIQIEYMTIPLYLTSLYSIMDDCNVEAYKLVKNIIVQEMLHFTQAANILIAIGGRVVIDSNETAPHFPITGLPGGVLPNLTLTLEKFTLKHVYENFMALEVPAYTTVPKPQEHWNTIGKFYNEIYDCLVTLGDKLFENPREEMQVYWPWELPIDVGTLYIVSNLKSALLAIDQIVEQGEGARADSPTDESTKQYAHFFRFEEIFCENKLEKLPGSEGYAYTGKPIPYNSNGVWNMKDSLSSSDIKKGTTCYTEARAFHHVNRKFLKGLQSLFDGHPEKVEEVLEMMQVLKGHAKRTLMTPLNVYDREPRPGEVMCGPIWDYYWEI